MLKAILFDLDDTLIEWKFPFDEWEARELQHLRGVYDYFCQIGPPAFDLEAYKNEYMRRTREAWMDARTTLVAPHLGRVLMQAAAAVGFSPAHLEERRCLEAYNWGVMEGTAPFPDVIEGLSLLRNRGVRMGVITNAYAPMWLRDYEMAGHGLLEFFSDCRFSAADVGYLKPHPDIFAAALNCLGAAAEETIFVGDNPIADIAGAQVAGMRAVLRVKNPPVPLISGLVVPDAAINSLYELPAILDEWFPGW